MQQLASVNDVFEWLLVVLAKSKSMYVPGLASDIVPAITEEFRKGGRVREICHPWHETLWTAFFPNEDSLYFVDGMVELPEGVAKLGFDLCIEFVKRGEGAFLTCEEIIIRLIKYAFLPENILRVDKQHGTARLKLSKKRGKRYGVYFDIEFPRSR